MTRWEETVRGTDINHEPSHSDEAKAVFAEAIRHGVQIEQAERREDRFGENNTEKVVELILKIQKLCVQSRIVDANALHERRSSGGTGQC